MTTKTFFAALAALLFAFGLNAQPVLSDNAKVTAIPRLTGIPTCINMSGPLAEKVRKEVYNLGARQITVGTGACVGAPSALGFFFSQPKKLGDIQESGPGFSNYGTPWLVDAYAVIVKNGEVGDEVARAGSAMLAGQVNSGGLYKNTSPGEAIAYSEKRAVGKLFHKDAWHIGATEILTREFGSKTTTGTIEVAARPSKPLRETATDQNGVDAINAKATDLLAQSKKIEAQTKATKAEATAKANAEKRLKKAQAELDKAKAAAEKK